MVWELMCDCNERIGIDIDSYELFKTLETFFTKQASDGIFEDISDYNRIWYKHGGKEHDIYRQTIKYYKCKVCGCLWEFYYPEFPAHGLVRKFPDGVYKREEW